jgi:hypothetical protein
MSASPSPTGRSGKPADYLPRPRLRGEGRGEGLFFEFGQERLQYPIQILNYVIVPDADHPITKGGQLAVALPVFVTIRVLAAVEFNNQALLATHEIDVVPTDRLLADEFEASELPSANACPQREFCSSQGTPQRARTLSEPFILAPHRGNLSASEACPSPRPSPRKRGEGVSRCQRRNSL